MIAVDERRPQLTKGENKKGVTSIKREQERSEDNRMISYPPNPKENR
jgi:hypothetical protein